MTSNSQPQQPDIWVVYYCINPVNNVSASRQVSDADPEHDAMRSLAPSDAYALSYVSNRRILTPSGRDLSHERMQGMPGGQVFVTGLFYFQDKIDLLNLQQAMQRPDVRLVLERGAYARKEDDTYVVAKDALIVITFRPEMDRFLYR